MHILDQIVAEKRREVAAARRQRHEAELRRTAEAMPPGRTFTAALTRRIPGRVKVIAEIKRASPSKGVIRADIDPSRLAAEYAAGGAAALSVLTDRRFFQGDVADLQTARAAVDLPVLRKDFVIDPYQIYETKVMGADAVLLIVRILEPTQLEDSLSLCRQLQLGALVETHSAAEIEVAVAAGARLVGINNRNLDTFDTDVRRAATLARLLGPDCTPVAESGIRSRADILSLQAAGIDTFLVGESLVRASDPRCFLGELISGRPASRA